MKFTPGPIGADFSGSIGSTTASRNRFGPYLRTKTIPVNPNTTRQQAVRSIFASLVNTWTNVLTNAQREAWTLWADNTTILGKDGNPINITGQNAFLRFNTVRTQIGGAGVIAAPVAFNNGAPVTSFETTEDGEDGVIDLSAAATAMATTLNISGGATVDGDLAIFLGNPVNNGRTFYKGPYQLADTLPLTALDVDADWTTTIATLLNAIAPADAQFRSIRMRVVYDDGRLSEKFEALADVELASI